MWRRNTCLPNKLTAWLCIPVKYVYAVSFLPQKQRAALILALLMKYYSSARAVCIILGCREQMQFSPHARPCARILWVAATRLHVEGWLPAHLSRQDPSHCCQFAAWSWLSSFRDWLLVHLCSVWNLRSLSLISPDSCGLIQELTSPSSLPKVAAC